MWNDFSEHVQPVGTSVKWFYASQYKQKVYRSAYSGGVHVVRYEPWLQVRSYQSSVTPPMSSALSSHMMCLECIVRCCPVTDKALPAEAQLLCLPSASSAA